MQMFDIDVAILGGGTAGAATAIALARNGMRVAVFERSDGRGARPGEVLIPSTRPLLIELGVWDHFQDDTHAHSLGVLSAWGTSHIAVNDFICDPHGHGWHIDRARFDRMLRTAAADEGAQVMVDTRVTSVRQEGGGWQLSAQSCDGSTQFSTRVLVDARGRTPVGLGTPVRLVYDRLVAIMLTFAGDTDVFKQDGFTLVESGPSGWFYSATFSSGDLTIAYMTDSDELSRGRSGCESVFWKALQRAPHTSRRLGKLHARTVLRVAPAHTAIAREDGKLPRLLVGDASFSIDPLSSQGMYHALESALSASQAIEAYFGGRSDCFADYSDSECAHFRRLLSARRTHYAAEARWPEAAFWRRRRIDALPRTSANEAIRSEVEP
jgi:flavin-dependent dehydrogenase